MRLAFLLLLLAPGCAHYRTLADCNEICKKHGLRFVRVEHGTAGYDPVERKIEETDACRCD